MSWETHPNIRIKGGGNPMSNRRDKHHHQKNKYQENNQYQKKRKDILTEEDINKILNLDSENVGILIEKADSLAKNIGDDGRKEGISSSKLRDFYNYVVRIKESEIENWYLKLMLLKPKMAYHVNKEKEGSHKREALELFNNEISKILGKIDKNDLKHFENFLTFFEAVVAYHKGYTKSK